VDGGANIVAWEVAMSGYIVVINAGSSSVKFALYDTDADVSMQFRGQVEGIGVAPSLSPSLTLFPPHTVTNSRKPQENRQ
jgi:acetate kinase